MSDTPGSSDLQQIEAARFRAAVSESLLQKMQANINYLLKGSAGLGSWEGSLLDETTFNAQKGGGTDWVLMDGRDVSSSAYAVLTGNTTVPDWRGRYPRMKDHGAGVDTHGELATGSTYGHQVQQHAHDAALGGDRFVKNFGGGPSSGLLVGFGTDNAPFQVLTNRAVPGGAETNPETGVTNFFLRVN